MIGTIPLQGLSAVLCGARWHLALAALAATGSPTIAVQCRVQAFACSSNPEHSLGALRPAGFCGMGILKNSIFLYFSLLFSTFIYSITSFTPCSILPPAVQSQCFSM